MYATKLVEMGKIMDSIPVMMEIQSVEMDVHQHAKQSWVILVPAVQLQQQTLALKFVEMECKEDLMDAMMVTL